EGDGVRLQRAEVTLIHDLQELHAKIGTLHGEVTQRALRVRELEGSNATLQGALSDSLQVGRDKAMEVGSLRDQNADLQIALSETSRTIAALYKEIGRLQGLLDMIYQSRTWKLHSIMERMKGRR